MKIIKTRLREPGEAMNSPSAVRNYLVLLLAEEEREVFMVLYLDAQNRVIAAEPLFHSTLTQTAVFPREVVKQALAYNAAGAIFAHNHPSGIAEPSLADRDLTQALKNALAMVDVRTHDHFIVGGMAAVSFAQRGLL